ncbi:hypothetical protein BDK51DRAFT_46187 [Blyttiomyces helicus]|uniref:GLTSCR protein conserved domain-containing protein n=1 Tax=Blyttiomyces helicus TaxID=388810 RepID=A0A4P9WLH7_9FUNG|nr:hypothetical protein BDK51DRAFT_46187 [Blyttiomyces helicus]|eukprot:RKO91506.1 hypothetical protein BDK51DRAFT_46187 [Blyttiomyces helicus]
MRAWYKQKCLRAGGSSGVGRSSHRLLRSAQQAGASRRDPWPSRSVVDLRLAATTTTAIFAACTSAVSGAPRALLLSPLPSISHRKSKSNEIPPPQYGSMGSFPPFAGVAMPVGIHPGGQVGMPMGMMRGGWGPMGSEPNAPWGAWNGPRPGGGAPGAGGEGNRPPAPPPTSAPPHSGQMPPRGPTMPPSSAQRQQFHQAQQAYQLHSQPSQPQHQGGHPSPQGGQYAPGAGAFAPTPYVPFMYPPYPTGRPDLSGGGGPSGSGQGAAPTGSGYAGHVGQAASGGSFASSAQDPGLSRAGPGDSRADEQYVDKGAARPRSRPIAGIAPKRSRSGKKNPVTEPRSQAKVRSSSPTVRTNLDASTGLTTLSNLLLRTPRPRIIKVIASDHNAILRPPPTAFSSADDAIRRLLPFHVFQLPEREPAPPRSADEEKALIAKSMELFERFDRWSEKQIERVKRFTDERFTRKRHHHIPSSENVPGTNVPQPPAPSLPFSFPSLPDGRPPGRLHTALMNLRLESPKRGAGCKLEETRTSSDTQRAKLAAHQPDSRPDYASTDLHMDD